MLGCVFGIGLWGSKIKDGGASGGRKDRGLSREVIYDCEREKKGLFGSENSFNW